MTQWTQTDAIIHSPAIMGNDHVDDDVVRWPTNIEPPPRLSCKKQQNVILSCFRPSLIKKFTNISSKSQFFVNLIPEETCRKVCRLGSHHHVVRAGCRSTKKNDEKGARNNALLVRLSEGKRQSSQCKSSKRQTQLHLHALLPPPS